MVIACLFAIACDIDLSFYEVILIFVFIRGEGLAVFVCSETLCIAVGFVRLRFGNLVGVPVFVNRNPVCSCSVGVKVVGGETAVKNLNESV